MTRVEDGIDFTPSTSLEEWENKCALEEQKHKEIIRAYLVEGVGYLIEGIDSLKEERLWSSLRFDLSVYHEAPEYVKTVIGRLITRTHGDIFVSKPVIGETATVNMVLTSGDDIFTFKVSKKADDSDVETDVRQRHAPSSVSLLVNRGFSDLELVRTMIWVLQQQQLGQKPPEPTAA